MKSIPILRQNTFNHTFIFKATISQIQACSLK